MTMENVQGFPATLGIDGRRHDGGSRSGNRIGKLLLIDPVLDYDFSGSVTSNTPIIKSTNRMSNLANLTSD
jgi:hypothetical protein